SAERCTGTMRRSARRRSSSSRSVALAALTSPGHPIHTAFDRSCHPRSPLARPPPLGETRIPSAVADAITGRRLETTSTRSDGMNPPHRLPLHVGAAKQLGIGGRNRVALEDTDAQAMRRGVVLAPVR